MFCSYSASVTYIVFVELVLGRLWQSSDWLSRGQLAVHVFQEVKKAISFISEQLALKFINGEDFEYWLTYNAIKLRLPQGIVLGPVGCRSGIHNWGILKQGLILRLPELFSGVELYNHSDRICL